MVDYPSCLNFVFTYIFNILKFEPLLNYYLLEKFCFFPSKSIKAIIFRFYNVSFETRSSMNKDWPSKSKVIKDEKTTNLLITFFFHETTEYSSTFEMIGIEKQIKEAKII